MEPRRRFARQLTKLLPVDLISPEEGIQFTIAQGRYLTRNVKKKRVARPVPLPHRFDAIQPVKKRLLVSLAEVDHALAS
jgi:hypothetical protein